jgi:hypothetical protein
VFFLSVFISPFFKHISRSIIQNSMLNSYYVSPPFLTLRNNFSILMFDLLSIIFKLLHCFGVFWWKICYFSTLVFRLHSKNNKEMNTFSIVYNV